MSKLLHIAFIGTKGMPATHGGIEKYVEELSIRLVKRGHKVSVFSRSTYSDFQGDYKGVSVIKLFAPRNKYTNMVSHTFFCVMNILLGRRNFDIIHIHGADMSIFSLFLKLKSKVIVTSHGRVYNNVTTVPFILKIFSRFAEMCYIWWPNARIGVSKALTDYYKRKNKINTFYIPVGIEFYGTYNSGNTIRDFGLSKKNYILFVGRLIPTKKIDLLIEAYKRLNSDKKLVIVGDAPYENSPYCTQLKKHASEKIRFLGFQYDANLMNLFKSCYFFVLPSENEGLPVTLLEALNFGCTIIASDIPANIEALNGYGITFRNGSVSDLSEKMKYLFNNPNILEGFKKNAVQYIKNNYNWDKVTEDHESLYKALIRR